MNKLARTAFWIIAIAFVILSVSMCSNRTNIADAAPLAQSGFPAARWLETRVRATSAVSFFELDRAATSGMWLTASCTISAAGTWYYNDDHDIVMSNRGGKVDIQGARVSTTSNLGTLENPIYPDGAWFLATVPFDNGWRTNVVPQRIVRPDGSEYETPLRTPDCGPFLPLITAGPADWPFAIFAIICITLIFVLRGNSTPRPPDR